MKKILALVTVLAFISSAFADSTADKIAAIKTQKNNAIFAVEHIVNQPVTHLRRTSDMSVSEYGPGGWFHPGAEVPDFDHVDVRTTQQNTYDASPYVTSDLNPGEVFIGRELEFNSMTKYFYTDRSTPKKKLTEAEMLEINRLYRIIGSCNAQLAELENPKPTSDVAFAFVASHKPVVVGGIVGFLLILLAVRRFQSREE